MVTEHQTLRTGRLIVVLGDQLDPQSPLLAGIDARTDTVWMCEAFGESRYVWSSKQRTVMFLSAMRHLQHALRERGLSVLYRALGEHEHESLEAALAADIDRLQPGVVVTLAAGEYRLRKNIGAVLRQRNVKAVEIPDSHYRYCSQEQFDQWADARKQLRLEHFYRFMRQKHGILLQDDGKPVGGQWNFDADNRKSFGRQGPGMLPQWPAFTPDAITRTVIRDVERHLGDHPGDLGRFFWPVTRSQSLQALECFVKERLTAFGRFQDAMWTDEAHLYHSGLSAALNLRLIHPREVIGRVISEYQAGRAPLGAVEGFVRQVIGWREFVQGVYWRYMPNYAEHNELRASHDLPNFYWTGETDMLCLRQTIQQTLSQGYAHHIQRLMVTGLFALLYGVEPRQVHEWYLAVYVDAVEWVEMPNTMGMSQFADGGVFASKPYVASGQYINRMSNYCRHCPYDPSLALGSNACPFTTLYWDFLQRHRARFENHPRAALQWRNLGKVEDERLALISAQADRIRCRSDM